MKKTALIVLWHTTECDDVPFFAFSKENEVEQKRELNRLWKRIVGSVRNQQVSDRWNAVLGLN
jgi:hypothetical protein